MTPRERGRIIQALEVAQDDRDAVILWLKAATCSPASRRAMAASIMVRSVFIQAHVLGLVECDACGDRGCELCRPKGRAFRW